MRVRGAQVQGPTQAGAPESPREPHPRHLGMLMKMRPSMLGSSTSCCSTCSRISLCRLREWLIFCSPTRTYTPLLWNLQQEGVRARCSPPQPLHTHPC